MAGMLTTALFDLGNPPKNRCKMVGDSWVDVAAAKAAGVKGYQIERNSDGLWKLVNRGVIK